MGFRSKKQAELLTFQKCNEMFKKARYCKYIDQKGVRLENNTYLLQHADCYCIQFHKTDIIDIYPDRWVIRNNGWRTPSTKDRINRMSPISIEVSKGCWYYRIGNWTQETHLKDFVNGLTVTKLEVFECMI